MPLKVFFLCMDLISIPQADSALDVLAKIEALSVSDVEDLPSGIVVGLLSMNASLPVSADNWNNSDADLPSDSESEHFGATP